MNKFNKAPTASGETGANNNENQTPDFEPWNENLVPAIEAPKEQKTAEDARADVIKALKNQATVGDKFEDNQRVDMAIVKERFVQNLKDLKENPPDDVQSIDSWIDSIDNLAKLYSNHNLLNKNSTEDDIKTYDDIARMSKRIQFDYIAYMSLSEKHGADMPNETRQKVYNLLENKLKDEYYKPTDDILHQIRKNQISLESSAANDAPESKVTEEKALDTFERIGMKDLPDLDASEKENTVRCIGERIAALESLKDLQERYLNSSGKESRKLQERINSRMKNDGIDGLGDLDGQIKTLKKLATGNNEKLFEQEKRRKFLYEQALQEKKRVSGFMNSRKLKQPEFFLPEPKEFQENPYKYSENDLRDLALEYVRLQQD